MSKYNTWKPSYESTRKYNPSWEQTYHWLRKNDTVAEAGPDSALCTICNIRIPCKLSHIKRHEQVGKHIARSREKNQAALQRELWPNTPCFEQAKSVDPEQMEGQMQESNQTTMEEEENDGVGGETYKADLDDEANEVDNTMSESLDTTAEFLKVFQGKTEFGSWEEFNTLFEEFQRETGSAFKPKSVKSIEYANDRRMRDAISARFVYQAVKMVCQHFGRPNPVPVQKDGSARKPRKYLGVGCEAMVHLRYKGGSLNIVGCNLEHKNHALFSGNDIVRKVRSFSFTSDIDLLMAKVVMEHNPFSHWNSEKEWYALLVDLQNRDERMNTVSVGVVKRRIRFLIDRYVANSNGEDPLPGDEMGTILYELVKLKQDAMDSSATGRGKRKRERSKKYTPPGSEEEDCSVMFENDESAEKRKRGRPKSYAPLDSEEEDCPVMFENNESASCSSAKKQSGAPPTKDVGVFLRYLERKDVNDRRLKQADIDLRRGELELHKKELELHKKELQLQRQRFEFDRLERQAHMDLIKTQLEMLTRQNRTQQQHQQQQKVVLADPKGDGSGVTEYTIVVDNGQTYATH